MSATDLLQLTIEQQQAVNVGEGAYILVAPPGSGKTEILVRRVIRLLGESGGQMFRVLALTFTTKAAEALRARVLAALGEDSWRLTAGTFHAFCLDVLQHYGDPVGVTASVTVLAALDERLYALNRALEGEGYLPVGEVMAVEPAKALLGSLDALRGRLVSPADAPEQPLGPIGIPTNRLYQAYDAALTQLNVIDFPAMLERCYRLLRESRWTLSMLQRTYKYVLVDEAQDTTFAQFEILRALVDGTQPNVFVVADRNQAIYGFAGGDTRFLDEFEASFKAQQLPLTSNFRCAASIVELANGLAKRLPGTTTSDAMVPAGGAIGHVDAWILEDEADEAKAVCEWIRRLLDDGISPGWGHVGEDLRVAADQVCVLARTRYALDPVRATLDEAGIDAVLRTSEGGLFDSDLGQAVYFLVRASCNPLDVPAIRKASEHCATLPTPGSNVPK